MSDMEEYDGLELSLGLSLGGSFAKLKAKDAVKPLGLSSNSQKALSSVVEPSMSARRVSVQGDVAMADQALSPDARISENPQKQDQRKHEDPTHQSRDQVWQALQKNGAVSVLDPMHAEAATAFQELKDASASLWSRRSASMQLMMSAKEGSEAASQCIRRSSSNGALMSMMPQQALHSSQAPLARQHSSLESRLENSPETPTHCQQQQHHEALELQRKKRLQAQRRQEARMRRKSLLEEKQHKKAKRDDMGLHPQARISLSNSLQKNTFSSATTEDASLSHALSGVQRLDGKQWEQTSRKSRTSDISWAGNDKDHRVGNDQAEAQQKFNHHSKSMNQGEELKGSMTNDADKGGLTAEPDVAMELLGKSESKVEVHQPLFAGGLEHGSIPRAPKRKIHHIGMPQGAAPAPSRDVGNAVVELRYGGKASNNSTSESETGDTKEHSSVQNESGELEASSRKSATENSHCLGGVSPSLPSMVMAGNSLAYPSAFPVLPIPYSFPVQGASPASLPLQLGYTLPCFMQYPAPTSRENPTASSSQFPGSFPVPVGSGMTPYHLSLPDGYFPWFPVVQAGEANKPPAGSLINNHTSNEREAEHPEGRCAEKSSITELSVPVVQTLQRSSSTSISKDQVVAQSLPSSKQLDCQVSASVGMSGVKPERMKKSSAVKQNLSVEGQQSIPPEGQTQQTHVPEQPILRPYVEGKTRPKGSESEHDPCGEYDPKNSVSRPKRLERSADGQLASKSSRQDSINQSGAVDGQKLGSMADLPWVSTTGVGPNGKTINGVMYISNMRQARIVCSCHGKHMSPAEFVQHSGSSDLSNPERNIVVNPFPFLNQLGTTPV